MDQFQADPKLSVVVVTYRMVKQIANTLRSLTTPYQRGIAAADFEIVLVDNGSPEPLQPQQWAIAENVHYHYLRPESGESDPNPGVALNWGVRNSRAPLICVMIDGARLVTPGTLHWGRKLASLAPDTVVDVRGWHLGPMLQNESITKGYDHETERQLLAGIEWPSAGYRLFEIGVPSASTPQGFLGRAAESCCLFMSRQKFDALGGYDERYRAPGGGLCNVDFFWRVVTSSEKVLTLLGEGHFHQVHGGAATGLTQDQFGASFARWREEYERLSRALTFSPPYEPILAGHLPTEARRWLCSLGW